MNRPSPSPTSRVYGALLGLVGGARLGAPADAELALLAAEEVARGHLDFGALARAWSGWLDQAPADLDPGTRAALQHLRDHDRPPAPGECPAGHGSLARALPVALATFRNPAVLLSASYHAARLTDADERATWAAVAVNVTAAQFLLERRDFVPDVIEALRVNEAPGVLLDLARRIPIMRRADLPLTGAAGDAPVRALAMTLWAAHHEPSLERAMAWLPGAERTGRHELAATAALFGARDGQEGLPGDWEWSREERARVETITDRLVRHDDSV